MGPASAGGGSSEDVHGKTLHWDGNLMQWQIRTKTVIAAKSAWRHTAPLSEQGAKARPMDAEGLSDEDLEKEQDPRGRNRQFHTTMA
jgi:hypothetical protein